jgi:hypothetical protein
VSAGPGGGGAETGLNWLNWSTRTNPVSSAWAGVSLAV